MKKYLTYLLKLVVVVELCHTCKNIHYFGGGLHSQSHDWYWQTKQYSKIHKLNTTQKANNTKYSKRKLPWFSHLSRRSSKKC